MCMIAGLTRGIVLVRVVSAIRRARPEYTPEGTAVQAGLQSRQIDMLRQAALLEGLSKLVIVDVVVIKESYEYSQVIVSI